MARKPENPADPIRETTAEAIRLAKTLVREARFGALAVIEPQSGFPFSSRVAVATAPDGTPVILVSRLSGHTKGLLADPRCSILLGEPGKGDPLAHPRITIMARAHFLNAGNPERDMIAERYLRRNPKSKLYAGFADFSFVKLVPDWASLNGGFGQAYRLDGPNLLDDPVNSATIAEIEPSAIGHMESDHNSKLQSIGIKHGPPGTKSWRLTGIDSTGLDLIGAKNALRVWFDTPAGDAMALQGAIRRL